ncbi:MAG: matrixin family metalloprotease [Candidatus Paceibacterota bacterium]
MPQLLIITIIFILISVTSFWYTSSANICPAPIKYSVGSVDDRFEIEEDEIKVILERVEALWEKTAGRDLFIYDPASKFTVNFIYDERQQLVRTEEEWRISLDEEEKYGKELLEEVNQMNEEYKKVESEYKKQRGTYENRLATYNKKVEDYNSQGGAPENKYKELQKEQEYLSEIMSDLIIAENNLNSLVNDINKKGEEVNLVIEKYNQNVKEYNEIFGNREVFTQGDFKRERINIYKFSNETELSRVLAHEFGHSLGIEHVEGNESIMYYLMDEESGSLVLSEPDKVALVEVCGDGTGFSHKVKYLINSVF